MLFDHESEHPSRCTAIMPIQDRLHGTDVERVGQEGRGRQRPEAGLANMAVKLRLLERENLELWQTNEILRKASACCGTDSSSHICRQ